MTAGAGTYSLSGFGAGAYTVTPTKTGGVNGISSFDAALIAQHVAGPPLPHLSGNQLIVADVSGNGIVSSFDAGLIARYVASVPGTGLTGNWIFNPVNRTYPSVTANIAGEDYIGLLMGEVSGNWTNSGARPVGSGQWRSAAAGDGGGDTDSGNGPERSISVNAPRLVTPADYEVIVPVTVEGAAEMGIISYEFHLRYDPSVIQAQANPIELAGTVSSGLSVVANAEEAGLLRVAIYGATPIDGNGILLNLRFMAVGAPGSTSQLTWERIMFNEGSPRIMAADGLVELTAATR